MADDLNGQIEKAKKAGYSDADILAHLSKSGDLAPKIKAATDAGYKADEILGHLSRPSGYAKARATADAREAAVSAGPLGGFESQISKNLGVDRDLSGGVAYAVQGADNLVRRATGRPVEIPAGVAYQAAADASDAQRDRYAAAHPRGNIGAGIAGMAIAGAPAKASAAIALPRLLRGTAITAAPIALANQKGSLAERIPGAALDTGVAMATVGMLHGGGVLARRALSQGGAGRQALADTVSAFDKAGVRPTLAAVGGKGAATIAKASAENALAGGRVRAHLAGSLDDTAHAAGALAQKFGAPTQRATAGEAVQQGVRDFNSRFGARAGKLYDRAFSDIERGQTAAEETAKRQAALRTGQGAQSAQPKAVIEPQHTLGALGEMGGRVNATKLSQIITDPRLSKIAGALEGGAKDLKFGDLRALRTWVREAQGNETLRQGITQGGLKRLEGALTQDIGENASRLAGPTAARRLQQADQFYRLGSQRIEGALQSFVGKGAPKSGEATYDTIVRSASDKGGADLGRLTALRKSLTPDEWRDVGASVIDRMGKSTPGVSHEDAFSVSRFSTAYHDLSDAGRDQLFGKSQLREELDNLVKVAGLQKGVEAASNASKSAINLQTMGSVVGLAHPATTVPTATGLGAIALTGEAMSNPRFVRWLAGVHGSSPKALRSKLGVLTSLAARDPALVPIRHQFAQAIGLEERSAAEKQTR